ncbi:MAG: cytochrome o ubiquinol oxidase subunit IV [Neisseriaceae bacterium]|nr:cytochrome o ubiquinol oxidase subunit IV [Neisseriaceae bacterium]MBP6861837.1 cytochrome o ubiquinol oxidase subunit IV [Neisseriaceae bacterium]
MTPSSPTEHGGSVKSYLIGLVLCLLLTGLSFYLAMTATGASGPGLLLAIVGLALVQIIIQLVYFLHMFERGQEWTIFSMLFTLLILFIVVGGSLWIMRDLNANMMSF